MGQDLTNERRNETYKDLLQVGSGNTGLSTSLERVSDGVGTEAPIRMSTTEVDFDSGSLKEGGTTILNPGSVVNGIVCKTSSSTLAGRSITAGSSKISIVNGDGVATNPSIDASEGNFNLANIGGLLDPSTQLSSVVAIANGGTGQSTANTALNALLPSQSGNSGKALTTDGSNASWALASASLPKGYSFGGKVSYSSASTIAVAALSCKNTANDDDIVTTSSTNVVLSTTGAINGTSQSSNLTGTITVVTSTAVSGSGTTFLTDFQVGDVITTAGGQSRRITVVSDNLNMTVESAWSSGEAGVTYKRGGEAPSTHYYLYALGHSTTPGFILTTRNVSEGDSLVDLPSGYSSSNVRQRPFAIRNDASSNIVAFWHYPAMQYVQYAAYTDEVSASIYQVYAATLSGTSAAISCASIIPAISRLVHLRGTCDGANSSSIYVRSNGGSETVRISTHIGGSAESGVVFTAATDSSRQIQAVTGAAVNVYLGVLGWHCTEDL